MKVFLYCSKFRFLLLLFHLLLIVAVTLFYESVICRLVVSLKISFFSSTSFVGLTTLSVVVLKPN